MCHCVFDEGRRIRYFILLGLFLIDQTFGHTRPLSEHEILHLKDAAEKKNSTEGSPLINLFGHMRKERCFSAPDYSSYATPRPQMPWQIDPRLAVVAPRRPVRNSLSAWENAAILPLGLEKHIATNFY